MNKLRTLITLVIAAFFMTAIMTSCGGSGKTDKDTKDSTKTDNTKVEAKGTMDEAKTLVAKFLVKGADYTALSKDLRPTKEDAKAIFIKEEDATKAFEYVDNMFGDMIQDKDGIKPEEGQTESIVKSATGKDFKEKKGDAEEFPGGYKDLAPRLKDDVTFYLFKFVKKGETSGMRYEGLVFVNNHWVIFPKLYRAFKEKK